MKQQKIILLFGILSLTFLLMLSACDISNSTPNPPHVEADLVIELLSALKNKNYQLADNKLQRLKAIDSSEIFLENIQTGIKNNQLIFRAQNLLNSGKIDDAIESLDQSISVQGENSALVGALNQLKTLMSIKKLTDNVLKAENSRDLAISSGKLNRMINSYPQAKLLTDFSSAQLNSARSMLVLEKAIAVEDLKADIDIAWVKCKTYLDTMIASMEVEDPNNSLVLTYKKAMSQNWVDENINEIYYVPELEFIFFRKGLIENNKIELNTLYQKILYISPDSFRSMLIKSIILKFLGYQKESSVVVSQIAESVSASSSIVKQWLQLYPDSSIRINKINPFVLYPFFIYYDRDLSNTDL